MLYCNDPPHPAEYMYHPLCHPITFQLHFTLKALQMSNDPFEKSVVAEPIRDAIHWLNFSNKTRKMLFLDALNSLLDDAAISAYTGSEQARHAFARLATAIEDEIAELEAEKLELISATPDISESDDVDTELAPVEITDEDVDIAEQIDDVPPLPSEEERMADKEITDET